MPYLSRKLYNINAVPLLLSVAVCDQSVSRQEAYLLHRKCKFMLKRAYDGLENVLGDCSSSPVVMFPLGFFLGTVGGLANRDDYPPGTPFRANTTHLDIFMAIFMVCAIEVVALKIMMFDESQSESLGSSDSWQDFSDTYWQEYSDYNSQENRESNGDSV